MTKSDATNRFFFFFFLPAVLQRCQNAQMSLFLHGVHLIWTNTSIMLLSFFIFILKGSHERLNVSQGCFAMCVLE